MSAHPIPIEATASMAIYQLPNAAYRLKKPLLVEIERDESSAFVVTEPGTGVFHYDPDLGSALSGFLAVVVNEFEFLLNNQSKLSAALRQEFERFQQYLEPVQP
jgi:hypothetical protein